MCESCLAPFAAVTVAEPELPSLIPDGNLFCGIENPVLSELQANIIPANPTDQLRWYASASETIELIPTELLESYPVYYVGVFDPVSGCESSIRFEIPVDLTNCDPRIIQ